MWMIHMTISKKRTGMKMVKLMTTKDCNSLHIEGSQMNERMNGRIFAPGMTLVASSLLSSDLATALRFARSNRRLAENSTPTTTKFESAYTVKLAIFGATRLPPPPPVVVGSLVGLPVGLQHNKTKTRRVQNTKSRNKT